MYCVGWLESSRTSISSSLSVQASDLYKSNVICAQEGKDVSLAKGFGVAMLVPGLSSDNVSWRNGKFRVLRSMSQRKSIAVDSTPIHQLR